MMKRELVCVICPNGCELEVEYLKEGENFELQSVKGQLCKKGPKWAEGEIKEPQRTISTSVLVEGGELPLVSVRTTSPVPLDSIFDLMKEIKKIRLQAPVRSGQVVLKNPKGIKTLVIATKDIAQKT
ncbi:MAG: DUF1667 domain-containing protein [Desulfatiglandales bacterium]